MNILIVDDDRTDREKLAGMIKKLKKDSQIFVAENGDSGYKIALEHNPEVLFIDYKFLGSRDLGMAGKLRKTYLRMNVILISSEESNSIALESFRIHASGYIVRPFTMERLENELWNLRYPVMD